MQVDERTISGEWSPRLSSWSVGLAIFAVFLNLLAIAVSFYISHWLLHHRTVLNDAVLSVVLISTSPVLALLVLRRCFPLVLFFAFILGWILKAQFDQVIAFYAAGPDALVSKWDSPGVSLLILGMLSILILVVRVVAHIFARLRQ
ncbi:hypothetical protein LQG66_32205 [Bradyrhizobium ontarionense]|uniref:Uncharacterized protein n=1 Tax=Bradyrhizobium ontarionense TaxID=2898149 RepID=A0ABY3R8Y3_9BRAD|nr:hypothetical protein [Bradyrhizobium sp. A19]UFZ03815.1 hypothetical protein LQG66_32205 [Bradyrhizobium sp. A19]